MRCSDCARLTGRPSRTALPASFVLSLTKLNYNACKLGDNLPVTVHFSDAVGEILVNNPKTQAPRPNFKYYI